MCRVCCWHEAVKPLAYLGNFIHPHSKHSQRSKSNLVDDECMQLSLIPSTIIHAKSKKKKINQRSKKLRLRNFDFDSTSLFQPLLNLCAYGQLTFPQSTQEHRIRISSILIALKRRRTTGACSIDIVVVTELSLSYNTGTVRRSALLQRIRRLALIWIRRQNE